MDFEQLAAMVPERRSPRYNLTLSKNLKANQEALMENFSGLPPDGAVRWTKLTLFLYLQQLEHLKVDKLHPFLMKIINKRRSEYSAVAAVYKSYRKWKATG